MGEGECFWLIVEGLWVRGEECMNFSHVISHVTFTSLLYDGESYVTNPCCIVGIFT